MQRGIATFTLDYGRCPRWLFERMVKLGRAITLVLIEDFGPDEFVRRIAHPVWFQSLGTVLAFDWNASGLTTVLTAALKEAISGQEKDLGVVICGGKGRVSRQTPDEIGYLGEKIGLDQSQVASLVYNSKMTAKVDSSLVQDGFQIYHHTFFFTKSGSWAVVQQGMNIQNQTARRYHWQSGKVSDLVCEPHVGIASQMFKTPTLNLTAKASDQVRTLSTKLVLGGYKSLLCDIQILQKHASSLSQMVSLKTSRSKLTLLQLANKEFKHHPVEWESFFNSRYLMKILSKLCSEKPQSYEELLAKEGVGPKTIRALALVSEVIYGATPSYEDPARYSFAHGGKDATPYPVDKTTYDEVIDVLTDVVRKAQINILERDKALRRLQKASLIK